MFNIFDCDMEINVDNKIVEKVDKVEGYIEMKNIYFFYFVWFDVIIFKNFNFLVCVG